MTQEKSKGEKKNCCDKCRTLAGGCRIEFYCDCHSTPLKECCSHCICTKCESTPSPQPDWVKEFEKLDLKFLTLISFFSNSKNLHSEIINDFETIKSFISKTLSSYRDQVVKELEGMKKGDGCCHDQDGACYAGKYENQLCDASYDIAISDSIAILKKLQ